jgi:hypothetical protein
MNKRVICKSALAALACALLAWGVVVRREADVVLATPPSQSESATDLGSAIHADFDGDQKPDFVKGSAVGGSYVLQILFSTDTPTASLRLSSGVSGIRILSRDVNQDHDEDLIVTSCTSPIPVAVFLGDGKGHFQPGNPWNYIPVGIDSPYSYRPITGQTGSAGDFQQRRLPACILSGIFAQLRLKASCRAASGATGTPNPVGSSGRTPRGPPATHLL